MKKLEALIKEEVRNTLKEASLQTKPNFKNIESIAEWGDLASMRLGELIADWPEDWDVDFMYEVEAIANWLPHAIKGAHAAKGRKR